MSGPSVTFVVEDEGVSAMLSRVEGGIQRLVEVAAVELELDLRREAGGVQPKLGEPWEITGAGPVERSLEAPEWWAHFFSGGTRDHGPATADALKFQIDGDWVVASHVRGIPASHFDDKAIRIAEERLPATLGRVLEELA